MSVANQHINHDTVDKRKVNYTSMVEFVSLCDMIGFCSGPPRLTTRILRTIITSMRDEITVVIF